MSRENILEFKLYDVMLKTLHYSKKIDIYSDISQVIDEALILKTNKNSCKWEQKYEHNLPTIILIKGSQLY